MQVIIQIDRIDELDEIREWLSKRPVRIETRRSSRAAFLALLGEFSVDLPADYRFDRDEANER